MIERTQAPGPALYRERKQTAYDSDSEAAGGPGRAAIIMQVGARTRLDSLELPLTLRLKDPHRDTDISAPRTSDRGSDSDTGNGFKMGRTNET
jgi:hypothetical protein